MITIASAPSLQSLFQPGAGASGAASDAMPIPFEQLLGSLFRPKPASVFAAAPATNANPARLRAGDQDTASATSAAPDLLALLLNMGAQRLPPMPGNAATQANVAPAGSETAPGAPASNAASSAAIAATTTTTTATATATATAATMAATEPACAVAADRVQAFARPGVDAISAQPLPTLAVQATSSLRQPDAARWVAQPTPREAFSAAPARPESTPQTATADAAVTGPETTPDRTDNKTPATAPATPWQASENAAHGALHRSTPAPHRSPHALATEPSPALNPSVAFEAARQGVRPATIARAKEDVTAVDGSSAAAAAAVTVAHPKPAATNEPSGPARLTTPAAMEVAQPVGHPGWKEAISQRVQWMVQDQLQSASLTLNPRQLGPVQVTLQIENQQASVQFFTANPVVQQALQDALPTLRDMFGQAGIQLGQADVGSQPHHGNGEPRTPGRPPRDDGVDAQAGFQKQDLDVRPVRAQRGLLNLFA